MTRIYPSVAYKLSLNESTHLIRADTFWATTGDRGEGVKIGVVDDGVDERHVFFAPTGMSYPAGFPKGGRRWTTPKVIVARAYPGPGSGRRGRLPIDRKASFHGTHVAGIAAGRSGTYSPGGLDHPPVANLSGVAPNAWIGNYRVFNVPTRGGYTANTPEIVAAFEAAVRDGMDVINFSGGASETDPVNDALIEAVSNVAAAGVVPVIAAGNARDDFGLGSIDSPGSAPDAITVAASSNLHVFAPSLSVQGSVAPSTLRNIPFRTFLPRRAFPGWETQDQTLVDVGSVTGTDGRPVDRQLCGVRHPNELDTTLPPNSLRGKIALVSRGGCAIVTKEIRAAFIGDAKGMVLVDNRSGEANDLPLDIPAGTVADLDGARLRDFLVSAGGSAAVRFDFAPQELHTGRGGIITSFSSAGPTAYEHLLKPDVTAPGGEILSSTLPEFAGASFASFNGTSMATPHVAGAAALLLQRHPGWTPVGGPLRPASTAGPAWADTAQTTEASVFLEGSGMIDVPRADDPMVFTSPSSLSFGDLNVKTGAARRALVVEVDRCRRRRGHLVGRGPAPVGEHGRLAGGSGARHPGARRARRASRSRRAPRRRRPAGDDYGFLVLRRGAESPGASRTRSSSRARRCRTSRRSSCAGSRTAPRRAEPRASTSYRWPAAPFGYPPNITDPPVVEDGAERVYLVPHLNRPVVNLGVSVVSAESRRRDRPLAPRLARRERRAGRGGHAGRHQSADVRLRARDRRGRNGVPSTPALLRLGRLRAGRLYGQAASRPLPPALLGQRSPSAEDQAAHAPRRGRPPDACRASPGHRAQESIPSRCSSATGLSSSVRLPTTRAPAWRSISLPVFGAAAATREHARDLRRIRLPGGEEHHRASAPT